jgi:RNA polymerase sigma-70 factor (ECF subfamily)
MPMEVADWAPNPEQLYWSAELRDILARILEDLCPISRTVFVLRDIEGLSIEQPAAVMDLSNSAVKARLWRVRLQLRQRLSKNFINAESAREEFNLYQRAPRASLHSGSLPASQSNAT